MGGPLCRLGWQFDGVCLGCTFACTILREEHVLLVEETGHRLASLARSKRCDYLLLGDLLF